ncbi:MAG: hypothetical protein WBQ55_00005, partial [Xanthobacteraceae bacterium]
ITRARTTRLLIRFIRSELSIATSCCLSQSVSSGRVPGSGANQWGFLMRVNKQRSELQSDNRIERFDECRGAALTLTCGVVSSRFFGRAAMSGISDPRVSADRCSGD